jgi:hypothetical protein
MNTLITTNPHCFTYSTEELLIELLAGVRTDTLDRMRVTIKVSVTKRKFPSYTSEMADLAVTHNLDLYNDTQVEKFIRRVAERLEVGSVGLTKAIAEITFLPRKVFRRRRRLCASELNSTSIYKIFLFHA